MTENDVHNLIAAIKSWASGRPDVRALAVAGSWARGTARADSDLDLLILANEPACYRTDQSWLRELKLPSPYRVVFNRVADYGAAWSCHVLLEPHAKLELTFCEVSWASTSPIDEGTRRVVTDGLRVICDTDGHLSRLISAIARERQQS